MTQPWEQQGSRPYGGDGSGYGSDNVPEVYDTYGSYGSSGGYDSYTGSTPYGDYGGGGEFGGLTARAYQQYEQQSGGQMEPYRPQPGPGPQPQYQPQPTYPPTYNQQVMMTQVAPQKSAALAGILTFFFGPLGMLYSTVPGAITMFLVNLVCFFVFSPLLLITVPIGIVWSIVAANNHNTRSITMTSTTTTYR